MAGCCADEAVAAVRKIAPDFRPRLAIILGSGMGGVAEKIDNKTIIHYSTLPGFPVSTVQGHAGELILGTLHGVPVACLKGRIHLYEGIDPTKLRVPIYTLRLLGCEALFLTSAVGSLRVEVGAGELVALTDHINMQCRNPLIGPNDPIGVRFPSLLNAYDSTLRGILHEVAKERSVMLHDGVYLAALGPSFETPAEIRAFKIMGADVVGMSTVPEVILARHCGMRVAAISIVVNLASGLTADHITHDDTLFFSKQASDKLTSLLEGFVLSAARWPAPEPIPGAATGAH
eukprot:m.223746 g.223746  ORF g.223746 m.223746 type:complete len:289 (-) comp16315_c0_seq1:170-1036(-)